MAKKRLEIYVVRFSTLDEGLSGRMKVRCGSFEDIRKTIANRYRIPLECVQIESCVLIERE